LDDVAFAVPLLAGDRLGEAELLATVFLKPTLLPPLRTTAFLPPVRVLDEVDFAAVLLPAELAGEARFLEPALFLAVAGPRALAPRRALEAVVFADLAIHNSLRVAAVQLRTCPSAWPHAMSL
jgi:hypothetical protein